MRSLYFRLLLLTVSALTACSKSDGDARNDDARSGATTGGASSGGRGASGGVSSGGHSSGSAGAAAGSGTGGDAVSGGASVGGSAVSGGSSMSGRAGSSSSSGGVGGNAIAGAGAKGEGGSPPLGASGKAGSNSGTAGTSSSDGGSPPLGASGAAGTSGGVAGTNEAGAGGTPTITGLSWPVDCIPGETCVNLDYPDVDGDGEAFDCSEPGYVGHEGTDIGITFDAQAAGTDVWAAADGVVLFAFDGKYDQCPNDQEPDCQDPETEGPGSSEGTTVCTPLGPYCGVGVGSCYWCFAGGNVIVIRHADVPGVFATRYDHLKRNSLLVEAGDTVTRGQKLAEAASAGSSTGPHLHFEVWGTGFYEVTEPWAGTCGPNTGPSLWADDPPWAALLP